MSKENTTMEHLFHRLDDKAKTLNKESGQSFIENLRLVMGDIYINQKELLEQVTLQDGRKASQFVYLSLSQEESIQANHQIILGSIGPILGSLAQRFLGHKKEMHIVDIVGGTDHLSTVMKEVLSDKTTMHHLIEVNPVSSHVSVHLVDFLEIPLDVHSQDATMPLLLKGTGVVVGGSPVGYYPLGERSRETKLGFEEGHSYSHHLSIEQSINVLRGAGYAFLVVPDHLFEDDKVKQLESFIVTETEM